MIPENEDVVVVVASVGVFGVASAVGVGVGSVEVGVVIALVADNNTTANNQEIIRWEALRALEMLQLFFPE